MKSVSGLHNGIRVISAVFLVVGVGIFSWGIGTLLKAQKSSNWPSTSGLIVFSGVKSKDSKKHPSDKAFDAAPTSYQAAIKYKYAVNGKVYTGDTLYFGDIGIRTRSRAEKIVLRYPKGEKVPVFYDPKKPKTAVLMPGITKDSFGLLGLGLICIFGSLHMIFSAIRKNRDRAEFKG